MKKVILAAFLAAFAFSAHAQSTLYGGIGKEVGLFSFPVNAQRFEVGFSAGQVGSHTDYADFGIGFNVLIAGVYVDYIGSSPQHKYDNRISDTQWNDSMAFSINAGYQIPILRWLRIMPLVGYSQTNEGITDGSSIYIDSDEDGTTWSHRYKVTPGTRIHYVNYGGGLSIQPCKWFSINAIYTKNAIYGGIAVDLVSISGRR